MAYYAMNVLEGVEVAGEWGAVMLGRMLAAGWLGEGPDAWLATQRALARVRGAVFARDDGCASR